MSPLNGFQRGYQTLFILTVSVLSFFAFHHASFPLGGSQHTPAPTPHRSSRVVKRIGVPFGHDQPHKISNPAPEIVLHEPARIQKRALTFFDAVCKGQKHLANIVRAALLGTETGNRYRIQELEDSGWSIDDTYPLRIPVGFFRRPFGPLQTVQVPLLPRCLVYTMVNSDILTPTSI